MPKDLPCICEGNWRLIVDKYDHLIDKRFINSINNEEYTFFGIVHASDDYYYGMCDRDGKVLLVSCVGDLETSGFSLK